MLLGKYTPALRNRALGFFLPYPQPSAPPQAEEDEGTGDRRCRRVTLQLGHAQGSALTHMHIHAFFSLCFLGISQLLFQQAIWGLWASPNTDDRRNVCHTCETTSHPATHHLNIFFFPGFKPVTDEAVTLTQINFLQEYLKPVSPLAYNSVTVQHDFSLQSTPALCKLHTKRLFPESNI